MPVQSLPEISTLESNLEPAAQKGGISVHNFGLILSGRRAYAMARERLCEALADAVSGIKDENVPQFDAGSGCIGLVARCPAHHPDMTMSGLACKAEFGTTPARFGSSYCALRRVHEVPDRVATKIARLFAQDH